MAFKNLRKHLPKTKVDYMRYTAGRPALLSSGAAGAAAAAAAAATTTTAAAVTAAVATFKGEGELKEVARAVKARRLCWDLLLFRRSLCIFVRKVFWRSSTHDQRKPKVGQRAHDSNSMGLLGPAESGSRHCGKKRGAHLVAKGFSGFFYCSLGHYAVWQCSQWQSKTL